MVEVDYLSMDILINQTPSVGSLILGLEVFLLAQLSSTALASLLHIFLYGYSFALCRLLRHMPEFKISQLCFGISIEYSMNL
jgi:hypothetical protein